MEFTKWMVSKQEDETVESGWIRYGKGGPDPFEDYTQVIFKKPNKDGWNACITTHEGPDFLPYKFADAAVGKFCVERATIFNMFDYEVNKPLLSFIHSLLNKYQLSYKRIDAYLKSVDVQETDNRYFYSLFDSLDEELQMYG